MWETSNRPAALAGVAVLGHQAGRVLHRHRIAGEGHHAGAELEMQGMQRGLLEIFGCGGMGSPSGAKKSIVK